MSRISQFNAFDALEGYREEILKRSKEKVKKRELTDDEINDLNEALIKIVKRDLINVTFYKNYQYIKKIGVVNNISSIYKYLLLDGEKISFYDILNIEFC